MNVLPVSAPLIFPRFDPIEHRYFLGSVELPSVTRILNDVLGGYDGVSREVMRRKAEIGEAVHVATAMYDTGVLDESSVPTEIAGYFEAWKRFRRETAFVPEWVERMVWSTQHGYAGTLDRTGFFERLKRINPTMRCLVDIKATAAYMPSVEPQTAAYSHAFAACAHLPVRHRFSVRLMPEGNYQLTEHTDPSDIAVFLSCLTVYHWRKEHA